MSKRLAEDSWEVPTKIAREKVDGEFLWQAAEGRWLHQEGEVAKLLLSRDAVEDLLQEELEKTDVDMEKVKVLKSRVLSLTTRAGRAQEAADTLKKTYEALRDSALGLPRIQSKSGIDTELFGKVSSARLIENWKADIITHNRPLFDVLEERGFKDFWDKHAQRIKAAITGKTVIQCESEQKKAHYQPAYASGQQLLLQICKSILDEDNASISYDDRDLERLPEKRRFWSFVNQPDSEKGRADIVFCGFGSMRVTPARLDQYCSLVVEYKAKIEDQKLLDAHAQVLSRAWSVAATRRSKVDLPALITNNVWVQAVHVTIDMGPKGRKFNVGPVSPFVHDRKEVAQGDLTFHEYKVDVNSIGFKEVVMMCWWSLESAIRNKEEHSIQVHQVINLRLHGTGQCMKYKVLRCCGRPKVTSQTYVVEDQCGQYGIMKVGPSRSEVGLAHALESMCLQWEQLSKERELLLLLSAQDNSSCLPTICGLGQTDPEGRDIVITRLLGDPLVPLLWTFPIGELLWLLLDISDALLCLHRLGYAHNDVHPRNMGRFWKSHSHRYYLYDFGCSSRCGEEPAIIVDPPFCTAKLLVGKKAGPCTDFLSLIFVVLKLFGTRLPWEDHDVSSLEYTCSQLDFLDQVRSKDFGFPCTMEAHIVELLSLCSDAGPGDKDILYMIEKLHLGFKTEAQWLLPSR